MEDRKLLLGFFNLELELLEFSLGFGLVEVVFTLSKEFLL
jgi:hypothetical protein